MTRLFSCFYQCKAMLAGSCICICIVHRHSMSCVERSGIWRRLEFGQYGLIWPVQYCIVLSSVRLMSTTVFLALHKLLINCRIIFINASLYHIGTAATGSEPTCLLYVTRDNLLIKRGLASAKIAIGRSLLSTCALINWLGWTTESLTHARTPYQLIWHTLVTDIYRVNIKKYPPTTFVDISAMHEDFCMKFYTTVKQSNIHFLTKFG